VVPLADGLRVAEIKLVASVRDLDDVIHLAGVRPFAGLCTRNAEEMITPQGAPPCGRPGVCDVMIFSTEFSPALGVAIDLSQVVQVFAAKRAFVINVRLQTSFVILTQLLLIYSKKFPRQGLGFESTRLCFSPLMLLEPSKTYLETAEI